MVEENQRPLSADELFMQGERMKLQNQPKKAIAYFKEFQKLKPDVPAVYFEIAKQYNRLRKQDSVLFYAKKAATLGSSNKWIQQFYARTLSNGKQFEKAAEIFHKLSLQYQISEHFLLQEVLMLMYAKNYDKALAVIDSMKQKNGESEELILRKQWIYFRQNKLDSVEKSVQRLVKLNPDNNSYYALLAEVYSKSDEPEKAINVYRELLERQPHNLTAQLALGVLYKKKGDTQKFRHYVKNVFESPEVTLEKKIDFVKPFLKYVEVDSTEKEDALWLSRLLTHIYPENPQSFTLLGNMYYQCKMSDSALLNYKKVLQLDSSDYWAWHQIMFIYAMQEKLDALLSYSSEAVHLFPENAEARIIRGMAFLKLGEFKKSASILQDALKFDIKNKVTKKMLYVSLATVYEQLNKKRKAKKYEQKAAQLEQQKTILPKSPKDKQ